MMAATLQPIVEPVLVVGFGGVWSCCGINRAAVCRCKEYARVH